MPGKRVQFDDATWQAIDLLARDRMMDFRELADEAFRDLLQKHGRLTDLKAALRQSAGVSAEVHKFPAKKNPTTGCRGLSRASRYFSGLATQQHRRARWNGHAPWVLRTGWLALRHSPTVSATMRTDLHGGLAEFGIADGLALDPLALRFQVRPGLAEARR